MSTDIRAALAAEPVGEGPILRWSENMPPSEDCRYDLCTAETPFGRFLISWKGWKRFDSPTVDETPWGDWYEAFNSVDAAKAACQKELDERLARWACPATPAAPEVVSQPYKLPEPGEVGELLLSLLETAAKLDDDWYHASARIMRSAATLLQQLSPPAPMAVAVAVAERPWEREGWCDEQGRCWFLSSRLLTWSLEFPPVALTRGVGRFLSLPAHAIPLPQVGEVEA